MPAASAEELLRQALPLDALAALKAQVRDAPQDAKLRVFLFQLLCVLGRWDQALTQLNVAADLDEQAKLMAEVGRLALTCEMLRAEVFAGKRTPIVFGQPAEWVGLLIQATALTANGNHAAAAELRDRAFDAAPAIAGNIDGQPFEWLADADERLGPIVEAIVDGRYLWIPLNNVFRITLDKPADLRDLIWTPAQFIWSNGGSAVGLIPTRYPGSETSVDNSLVMARSTAWTQPEVGLTIGSGQRLFATDAGEFPILETRRIEIGERPENLADIEAAIGLKAASAELHAEAGKLNAGMSAPGVNRG